MIGYICPHCGKPIYDDEALLCLFCGSDLKRGVGFLGKIKYSSGWIIVAAVVVILVAGLIILTVF